jgi:anthranilate/para-aminobenzoate synthase component II
MKIDYTNDIETIFDQKNTSSCTSNCLATILGFFLKKQGLYHYPLSRLYIYYNTRVLMKQVHEDNGSNPVKALEAVQKYGVCPENMWPLSCDKLFQKPPKECYQFAKKFPIELKYDTFKISEQIDWVKTCMKYLSNGILLFCEMKRFKNQKINENDYVDSVPNIPNIFYHGIVMVGLDEEEQYVIFINSHGFESLFFKMSFEQVEKLNPIQDLIYVIDCKYMNNEIFDHEKLNAILKFKNSDCIYQSTINNTSSVFYQKVYDHIIIGSGIAGKYLAYKLQKEFPNESILMIANDTKDYKFTNTTVNVSDCSIYSVVYNYFDIPQSIVFQLIKEFNIDENELEKNLTEGINNNDDVFKKIYKLLFEKLDINILDENNFLSTLIQLFQEKIFGAMYYETFLQLNGIEQNDIEYINSYLYGCIPNTALYYFILGLFGSVTNRKKIGNAILEKFIQNFDKLDLGDFLYEEAHNKHICLYNVHAFNYNTNSVEISKNNASSSIKINSKNIYICNLDTFRNQSRLETTNKYNVTIFLFLKNPISVFRPFSHEIWGKVNFISELVLHCQDVNIEFFNKMKIFMPIDILNNVFYPITICENIWNLMEHNKPISNLQFQGWMVHYYPYKIKLQQILENNENSFMNRMMEQLNCKGSQHHLNTNYSPLPLNIEGSFLMVDILIKNLPKLGIIYDQQDENNSINRQEMDEIVGFNKLYLPLNNFVDLDNFIDHVDVIIVTGSNSKNFYDYDNFIHKVLDSVKDKNLPIFFICFGFELLIHSMFPMLKLIKCDAENYQCYLHPYEFGKLSQVCVEQTFHDHSLGVKPDFELFKKSEYKIINVFNDRNNNEYIASIQNREYPIFGTSWHPFLKKTQNYLFNLNFLKNVITK